MSSNCLNSCFLWATLNRFSKLKLATSNYRTLLKMEAIGQSHNVRLHEVKKLIVNEHKEIENKKHEVSELKTILAEHSNQPKDQQEIVSSKLVRATT